MVNKIKYLCKLQISDIFLVFLRKICLNDLFKISSKEKTYFIGNKL